MISLRKSLFMSFKRCPQQGMYGLERNDQSYGEINTEHPALLKGQIFHHAMEDLYNEMSMMVLKEYDTYEDVHKYIHGLFPPTTQPDLRAWFDWYIDYESKRYLVMKEQDKLDYFMPYKQEMAVEYVIDGVKRTGHFDRVDRISDTELIIIEYKTGKSYDPNKAFKISDLRSELEWYRSIISRMDEFKEFTVVGWKLLNPTLGVSYTSKFAPTTQYSVDRNMKMIAEMIEGKREVIKKYGMQCNWCRFAQQCLSYDDEYHEIFGELSKEVE